MNQRSAQARWGRRATAAAALILVGCSGGNADAAGLREIALSAESIHVFSTPDVISRVVDLQPLPDGHVWVLNSTAPFFVVLAPDGRIARVFGQSGGGPEEFGAPWALARGASPVDVWTFDARWNTLVLVSAEERSEIALQRESVPPSSLISFKGAGINQAPPWLERIQSGFLLARDRTSQRESALQAWNADILLLEDDGHLSRYSPIADLVGDPATRFGRATTLLPYPVWTVCADGTVGLYDPLLNELRGLTPAGDELVAHELPEERQIEITVDRVFEMFYRQIRAGRPSGQLPPKEDIRRLTQEQNEELVHQSGGVFPEYADLHCTADGAFWIRRFDTEAVLPGQGFEWIRFARDAAAARVVLPSEFRTFRIEENRIWGTVPDALGAESVAWVEIATFQ